jgi:hypothetical protein
MAMEDRPEGGMAASGTSGDATATAMQPAQRDSQLPAEPANGKTGPTGAMPQVRSPFWVRLLQRYVFLYLFIVALGLVVDALLRTGMDSQARDVVSVLAWVSTALYALALVVLLVSFSTRLHLRRRRSKAIWLLYLGLAGFLVARGYYSASLLEPGIPQGTVAVVMGDLGLFSATAIVLGMIWGALDLIVYTARRSARRAERLRLPRFRRPAQTPLQEHGQEHGQEHNAE